MESYERETLVDMFGLYALHRRLYQSAGNPDAKLYRQLWALQKQVIAWCNTILNHHRNTGQSFGVCADFLNLHLATQLTGAHSSVVWSCLLAHPRVPGQACETEDEQSEPFSTGESICYTNSSCISTIDSQAVPSVPYNHTRSYDRVGPTYCPLNDHVINMFYLRSLLPRAVRIFSQNLTKNSREKPSSFTSCCVRGWCVWKVS